MGARSPLSRRGAGGEGSRPRSTARHRAFDAASQRAPSAWAKHLGMPVEITNSIGMKLVLIPPGQLTMGGLHRRSTRFGSTQLRSAMVDEVTQEEWEAVMDNNPKPITKGLKNPAERVIMGGLPGLFEEAWPEVRRRQREGTVCRPRLSGNMRAGPGVRSICRFDTEFADYGWCLENSERRSHPVGQKS